MMPGWKSNELCTVLEVADCKDDHIEGWFLTVRTEGGRIYGNEFIVTSEDYSEDITRHSGMPYRQPLDAFKWGFYKADTSAVQKLVKAFVENFKQFRERGYGLYICSEINGSGKTYLACCIATEIVRRYNTQVSFVTLNDYIGMLSAKDPEAQNLKDSVLLIVDDIGAQSEQQAWISDAVYRLVDYRYRQNLPTIYTSNMAMNKASKNDRVVARIIDRSHEIRLPEFSVREMLANKNKMEFLREVMNV